MQETFTLLLIGVLILIASVVSFVVMGIRQLCRTNLLAREAHEMDLHFSPSDLFEVPRRYGSFALISRGHGPRAYNVTHGHVRGVPVRAFDFRYEVGHATRRTTRHYAVIVVQTRIALGKLVMWHVDDARAAPLSSGTAVRRVDKWMCSGDLGLARALAEAKGPLDDRGASVEVRNETIMFCIPIEKRRQDYTVSLKHVDRVLGRIEEYCEL
ncbi:MAG: hypothetical protein QGH60_19060 [Phycisphaerae bacterium]|nr:hypothetical protein [Phycisphaerae bacterium]